MSCITHDDDDTRDARVSLQRAKTNELNWKERNRISQQVSFLFFYFSKHIREGQHSHKGFMKVDLALMIQRKSLYDQL